MKNIRLRQIANMVKKGMVVADIGTDHAFLPVMLVEDDRCEKCYACDIAEGPLQAAKNTIAENNMQEQIIPILSNGFENVPQDADGCVISGMGYVTAAMILENAIDRIQNMKQIVVEVNRDTRQMREWISSHGYTIDDECYVNDRGHDYVSISFTCAHHEPYSEEEILIGPIFMERNDHQYIAYCKRQTEKINNILVQSKGKAPHAEEMKRDLAILENFIK